MDRDGARQSADFLNPLPLLVFRVLGQRAACLERAVSFLFAGI